MARKLDVNSPHCGGGIRIAPLKGGGCKVGREQRVPPALLPPAVGYVTIGARRGAAAAVLFVNGENRGVLSGLHRVAVPAGTVRLALRATGCADWDSVLTVADSARIGYRRPSCPGDSL